MRKFWAEVIGTAVLVFLGCGVAIVFGFGDGYVGIALAFGLAVIAMAYSIGNISGAHLNPAISLGLFLSGKLSAADLIKYVLAQFLGAIIGAGLLTAIFGRGSGLGTNSYGANRNVNLTTWQAFLVEALLTFVFVLAAIGVLSKVQNKVVAGIVIGLSLTLVHLLGIPLTGTSVNPARSFGPALFEGGQPLRQYWLFFLAPLVGAALAALAYRALSGGADDATDFRSYAGQGPEVLEVGPWEQDGPSYEVSR